LHCILYPLTLLFVFRVQIMQNMAVSAAINVANTAAAVSVASATTAAGATGAAVAGMSVSTAAGLVSSKSG
jgi:predicted transcriptional regulator